MKTLPDKLSVWKTIPILLLGTLTYLSGCCASHQPAYQGQPIKPPIQERVVDPKKAPTTLFMSSYDRNKDGFFTKNEFSYLYGEGCKKIIKIDPSIELIHCRYGVRVIFENNFENFDLNGDGKWSDEELIKARFPIK